MLCSRCKKRPAVVFITRMEGDKTVNEGLCLKCAKELGIKPMAKMINMCSAGVEPKYMGIGPAYAIPKCLKGAGMDFSEVDYWEINEAFAAQFLGVGRKLKEEHGWEVDLDKTNANGSGISLGHPIGCTGLRIIVSMLYEMERRGATVGGASLWTKKMD